MGQHLLLEFHECRVDALIDAEVLKKIMVEAAEAGGATIVETVFHHFNPHGLSGVVVIAESHLTVHTWPEYGYAAFDVFTCGETLHPTLIGKELERRLGATKVVSRMIERGRHDA